MFVKDILGSKMYLLEDDVGLSQELVKCGTREEASVDYVKKIVEPDWTIIDIGANLGYYALLEARLGGYVYAIEPIKKSCETLKKSIKLNNYKNIKTYNLALGGRDEVRDIAVSNRKNWSTMINMDLVTEKYKERFDEFSEGVTEKVKTLTLDSFVKINKIEQVHFIRMDVEGYEVEIIKGADYVFSLMPAGSYLKIEIHPVLYKDRQPIIEMVDKIFKTGFKVILGTWKTIVLELNDESLKQQLLTRGKCAQIFFRKG